MRILLSGATGFIGKGLGPALAKAGHKVVALVRDVERAKGDLSYPCEIVPWASPGELGTIDGVIHLAGESVAHGRWTKKRKEAILTSRVETAQSILSLLKEHKLQPKVFLSVSAVGFYGDRGDEVVREENPAGQGFLAEVCSAWEKEVFRAEDLGCRVVVFRLGAVLGRGGGLLQEMLPWFRRRLGGELGSGKQWMSWIHLEDVIGIFLRALADESFRGRYNAVAPAPVTNAEFTKTLGELLSVPTLLDIPAGVLRFIFGEKSELFLFSQRVSAGKAMKAGYVFRYPELEGALREVLSTRPGVLAGEKGKPPR